MDPQASIQRIVDAFFEDDKEELDQAFKDLREWADKGGFKPKISKGAELVAIADAFEEWANYKIQDVKFILLNGWNGSINSMTYAIQSSGELTRGTIQGDLNPLEWIVSLCSDLYSELTDCVKIALKAANENYSLNSCDCDKDNHCDECGFDPAGNDYDELHEFCEIAERMSDFGDWLTECVEEEIFS